MAISDARFAQLLTEAIYRIRFAESKTIRAIQDELGYAIGKKGGSSIEHWRKGHIPTKKTDLENLARVIVQRSDLEADWLNDFLLSGRHIEPEELVNELFPMSISETVGGDSRSHQIIPAGTPNNLPVPPTPFIGREGELQSIARNLNDPDCRLLTLVGPGGIGKTRLALEAANRQLTNYTDGNFFVHLGFLNSANQLVASIANAINFVLHSEESPRVQLLSYLRNKQMLLIMDNFEHLTEEAGLLTDILRNAPHIKMLVTSRERLNLQSEWTFMVHPFVFPEERQGNIENNSAIQLFIQSARRVQSDFILESSQVRYVIQICELVGGIPLGIELAAAWVRMLACEEIAQEIELSYDFLATNWRDIPERHRSLQAVFEYSWNLLTAKERQVLSKLSVFRGGFRREAAAQVAGASLLTLSALVDKSLLHRSSAGKKPSEVRYEMHELLRQFAEEKLNQGTGRFNGQRFISNMNEAVHHLHAAYFANYLQECELPLMGERQREALVEITKELENIRAAWRWAIATGQQEILTQALGALAHFYDIRSWAQEGLRLFTEAVEGLKSRPGTDSDPLIARLIARQGIFYVRLARNKSAEQTLRQSIALLRKHNLSREVVYCLNGLGRLGYRVGEYNEALRNCHESLEICEAIGYEWGKMSALATLVSIHQVQGQYALAKQYSEDGLTVCMKISNERGIATFMDNLGWVQWRLAEYEEAWQHCEGSLRIFEEVGDRRGMATAYKNLGNIAGDTDRFEEAKTQYYNGLAIFKEIGYRWGVAAIMNNLGNTLWMMGNFNEAKTSCLQSVEIWRKMGHQWGVAASLETLGNVAIALDEVEEARACLHEALAVACEIEATPLLLDVFTGVGNLLVRWGKIDKALEILAFVKTHPAADQEALRKVQKIHEILDRPIPDLVVDKELGTLVKELLVLTEERKSETEDGGRKTEK